MIDSARGFTLIELLIVIALVGILTAASLPSFRGFIDSQRLSQASKQVKRDLRAAQNRALAGVEGRSWGIHFDEGESQYTIFSCPTTAAPNYTLSNCTAVKVIALPNLITIQNPTDNDLAFDAVSGDVYASGAILPPGASVSLCLRLGSRERTITVTAGGKIEEQ